MVIRPAAGVLSTTQVRTGIGRAATVPGRGGDLPPDGHHNLVVDRSAASRATATTAEHPATASHTDRTVIRAALAAANDDRIVIDLDDIATQYSALLQEFPGIVIRFAVKSCPVDEVLTTLARQGSDFDATSPQKIAQVFGEGVPPNRIHYGNTIKSDVQIAEAYRLGIRDFATDSLEDAEALAVHAPGSRVFCRLATSGDEAHWELSRKFDRTAAETGLIPSGVSQHVESQQMPVEAWHTAFDTLAGVLSGLNAHGITVDHVNLGGGLPALRCLDHHGKPLNPPLREMFSAIRESMSRLGRVSRAPLRFLMEPGRHLVADHDAIRAHVARLFSRCHTEGHRVSWLYLSCGKFNGLYEMDRIQDRLEYPSYDGDEYLPAVVAGPTSDSDDAFDSSGDGLVRVPRTAASGDPVWIFSCGAYTTAYTTRGLNGFNPLPYTCVGGPSGAAHGI
ncbi:hypothetical protein [Nocardia flavorosea]|uniref:hypothetical protein n=2 Tax=Nocardia flavorosea TaxID=53429 RepID=UPI00245848F8|nr:hypothetical protein [Nocardia flavorosea]